MEEKINKNPSSAVFILPGVTIVLGSKSSFVFAETIIQIDGECPKEIIQAIVKRIEKKNGEP